MTIADTLDDICVPSASIPASLIWPASARSLRGRSLGYGLVSVRRFERYSDHVLQDIGYERDWDGSIIGGDRL